MKIECLRVTQSSIRDPARVAEMVDFVASGGIFTLDHVAEFHQGESSFPLISLSRFPGGEVYVHDGHHRTLSVYLAGRGELLPEEYTVRDWDDFSRYNELNLAAGWVTPFDLISETRLPDVLAFKADVLSMDPAEVDTYVRRHRYRYAVPRIVETVPEFAECYRRGFCRCA